VPVEQLPKSQRPGGVPASRPGAAVPVAEGGHFDLNVQKVLEHWPVAFALREFIANALDEQALSQSVPIEITEVSEGVWCIRDFGRGLSYLHLTQKENPEKTKNPEVIGQFGIGLKDALAVCDRRRVGVVIRSRHGDITTAQLPKADFADVVTLHGVVSAPSAPTMAGTEVVVSEVSEQDVATAKTFFLRFSGDHQLEETKRGQVLQRAGQKSPGRIYVKGLLVAEEPNFLFSYNITAIGAPLRRALNRERSNVGRGAYSDRVKEILKDCRTPAVAEPLAADLSHFGQGSMHDELNWKDVAVHACRVLQSAGGKVVFVNPFQLMLPAVQRARDDGYRVVIVPEDIARALGGLKDLEGRSMFDLSMFSKEWNDSFSYQFVEPDALTPSERVIFAMTEPAAKLAGVNLAKKKITVAISETTRLSMGSREIVGVWEPIEKRIIIRRDQLISAARYCGTFLHELTHATSGLSDLSMEFEEALTVRMGTVASISLVEPSPSGSPAKSAKNRASIPRRKVPGRE
jgi:hypothetical protein